MAEDNQQEPVQPTTEDRLAKLETFVNGLITGPEVTKDGMSLGTKLEKLEAALEKAGIRIPVEPEPEVAQEAKPAEPETLTAVA